MLSRISQRPATAGPAPSRSPARQQRAKRSRTRPPSREGDGRAFPRPGSRLFPHTGALLHGTTDSGGPSGGFAGNGKRHHLLGLGRLKDILERSRGTNRGPRRKSARTPNRGGACGATAGRPLPAAGRGGSQDAAGKACAESVRCVTEATGHKHHRGRAGFRTPSPSTHTVIGRGGGRGEGPAGRARRAVPFAKECPSLVWRGLGPARESATSPHRSSGRAGANKHREEGRTRGADSRTEQAWPLP